MGIINRTFMLRNKTAVELYEKYAAEMPIIDYHCHLIPAQIAGDYRFKTATELFLGGDHYKWRQMRSAGIDERLITGDGEDFEKFYAFATVFPKLIGNPLYHWTSLELKRYFDIDEPLCPANAREIYDAVNARLAEEGYSARGLIERSNVRVLCTTDDPADDLRYHRQLREEGWSVKVLPTFRPDKAVNIEKDIFTDYIRAQGIKTYPELLAWLNARLDWFASFGCRLADHSIEVPDVVSGDPCVAFDKKMAGEVLTAAEEAAYRTAVLTYLAVEYEKRDWTMQIHIGALRNNNRKMFEKLGPDTGFDSTNDFALAVPMNALLDGFMQAGGLPKIILYSLNPKDNYTLGTMLGNFQEGPTAGRIQLGSGWWFNDNRDGMEAQLRALANLGVLATFVGMLTDSRSLVSYPRHEYFRRILCNLLGEWVENGEYPADTETLGEIVRDICYRNAERYFGF